MEVIYTYIPETNHVPMEYCVAAILLLLFMMPISLVPELALLLLLLLLLLLVIYLFNPIGHTVTLDASSVISIKCNDVFRQRL